MENDVFIEIDILGDEEEKEEKSSNYEVIVIDAEEKKRVLSQRELQKQVITIDGKIIPI